MTAGKSKAPQMESAIEGSLDCINTLTMKKKDLISSVWFHEEGCTLKKLAVIHMIQKKSMLWQAFA